LDLKGEAVGDFVEDIDQATYYHREKEISKTPFVFNATTTHLHSVAALALAIHVRKARDDRLRMASSWDRLDKEVEDG
jgi:hypothetical protein